MKKKDAELQVNAFTHVFEEKALKKYATFDLTKEDKKYVIKIIEAVEKFCLPKPYESVDRHTFFARVQEEKEVFDIF